MSHTIMIGCDLHDRTMLLRYSIGAGEPQQLTFENNNHSRLRMIERLKKLADRHGAKRIVFVYEASGLGHGLSDQLTDSGIECYVLNPTALPHSNKSLKQKTDVKDAQMLLEQVRGHVLAGNPLKTVWIPPTILRDDRDLVRARADVGDEITRVKLKITGFLKCRELTVDCSSKTKWTRAYLKKLEALAASLSGTLSVKLDLLVARLEHYNQEQNKVDKALRELSQTPRYKVPHRELRKMVGVGLLTAMTFLTEMGDLTRFDNRRQLGAYLGLVPASRESGETSDRKGRITRQGPYRLRKMLCQAAWVSVVHDEQAGEKYARIRQGQKSRSKKALVAMMRQLGIRMWHVALSAGVDESLCGRGGPNDLPSAVVARPKEHVAVSATAVLQPAAM